MWYRIARRALVANVIPTPDSGGSEPPSSLGTGALFFHTTSLRAVPAILEERSLVGGPFVSLAAGQPVYNDIRASSPFAVIAFHRANLAQHLMEVQYHDDWYNQNQDHAAYIAGEGWREQYEEPEDAYDEDGWSDDDYLAEDYDRAQNDAFQAKSGENEWVGKNEGDLPFDPQRDIAFIQVDNERSAAWLREQLTYLGLQVPVTIG
jgi:hypothetical protein